MNEEATGETWEDFISAGVAANQAGKPDEAVRIFNDAMPKAEAFGAEDLRVSATLDHLATALMAAGKAGEAEQALSRSIGIWDKTLGQHHPTYSIVAERLQGLADAQSAQEKYTEAEASLRRAWDILQRTQGPRSPELAPLLDSYAVVLRKMGREDDAKAIESHGRGLDFPFR